MCKERNNLSMKFGVLVLKNGVCCCQNVNQIQENLVFGCDFFTIMATFE
jgi:hypothetical protein